MTEEDLDHTALTFGKYEGQSPAQIADHDPSYVVWLGENIVPGVVSRVLVQACLSDVRENQIGHGGNRRDDEPRFR